MFKLSQLLSSVGNWAEEKRLLTYALRLQRERGNDRQVALILRGLSSSSWVMGLTKEGIQQAEEASKIFEQFGDTVGQAQCLERLTRLLSRDRQFDAAEEAASRAINLFSVKDKPFRLCESHRILGEVYQDKGETEKATHCFEIAFGIASPFSWHDQLFAVLYSLAVLFHNEGRFDDARVHIEHAKPHAVNNAYHLGRAMEMQARIWYKQDRLEEARSEALRAGDIYEKLGAAQDIESCRKLPQVIEKELDIPIASGQSGFNCELIDGTIFCVY